MPATLLKPVLSTPFPKPRGIWTCPITGFEVPKERQANLEYRANLLEMAADDKAFQSDLMAACQQSVLFWYNAFVWTFHQFDVDPETGETVPSTAPHVPFITWDIQDLAIETILDAMNTGHDLGMKKSRDMGASWICLGTFHHEWLFGKSAPQLLELSRVRDFVDQTGNMKALFQKHDYINSWLPSWMIPPGCMPGGKYRTKMHMLNILTGACIDGESTTEHAASGDRRKAILLDEFAKVEHGKQMRSATADVSPCRIVNSTPAGAHTEYSRWVNSGKIKTFVLPWWEHPEKGAGRYIVTDEITGEHQIRSPWYDIEDARRDPQIMAQEVDMNDLEAGDVFFSPQTIEKHRSLFARKPAMRCKIDLLPTISNDLLYKEIRRNDCMKSIKLSRTGFSLPLSVFVKLRDGRLDQRYTYTFGIDISKGQGASNSTICIICDQTREKVAEWADANVPPYEFARVIAAVALWVGGRSSRRLPFLIWEKNGPGWDVGRLLVKTFQYPYYYHERQVATTREKKKKTYGWQNNTGNNTLVMDKYRRMFHTGQFIEPSDACLTEMKLYITYPNGNIGPSELTEESPAVRLAHGDRVRGTSLALWGVEEGCKIKPEAITPPANSPAGRRAAKKRKDMRAKQSPYKPYDFTKELYAH